MSARVRVKICGITRLEDALAAVAAGADAIGFVFYPPSPRHVSPATAAAIVRQLPPFVTTVGLFVNPSAGEVEAVLGAVPLSLLQFHGEEEDAFCARFGRPWIKALAVQQGSNIAGLISAHPGACGLLLDAWHPQLKGGTGERFDWTLFPKDSGKPLVLAGGLAPGNVAEAIRATAPYAVDVSGGVEALAADGTVRKGIKDTGLIKSFIAAVNAGVGLK